MTSTYLGSLVALAPLHGLDAGQVLHQASALAPRFTTAQLLQRLGVDPNRGQEMRVSAILKGSGYRKTRTGRPGERTRFWTPVPVASPGADPGVAEPQTP